MQSLVFTHWPPSWKQILQSINLSIYPVRDFTTPHHGMSPLTWQSEADQFAAVLGPWLVLRLPLTSHLIGKAASQNAMTWLQFFDFLRDVNWMISGKDKMSKRQSGKVLTQAECFKSFIDTTGANVSFPQIITSFLRHLCFKAFWEAEDFSLVKIIFVWEASLLRGIMWHCSLYFVLSRVNQTKQNYTSHYVLLSGSCLLQQGCQTIIHGRVK